MNLRQNIYHYKVLMHQGADLLLLRLRILGLDLSDQATTILKIIAAIVFAGALFSFGMISLLFGLDSALGAEAKIWVFFGIALACLLGIAALAAWIMSSWQQKSRQIAATLHDMQQDIAYLRGQQATAKRNDEEPL